MFDTTNQYKMDQNGSKWYLMNQPGWRGWWGIKYSRGKVDHLITTNPYFCPKWPPWPSSSMMIHDPPSQHHGIFTWKPLIYPLVNIQKTIENGPVSGFSHIKHGGSFPSVLWQFTRPGQPEASHPPWDRGQDIFHLPHGFDLQFRQLQLLLQSPYSELGMGPTVGENFFETGDGSNPYHNS